MTFKRRISTKLNAGGDRKEIILLRQGFGGQVMPQGYENKTPTKQQAQNALVTCPERSRRMAVVRGHIWRDLLESGKVKSIAEIARANKPFESLKIKRVDDSYVSRMLDLTLLAPDIIEAILDGKEQSGLSIAKLIKKQIPLLWEEQRQHYQ